MRKFLLALLLTTLATAAPAQGRRLLGVSRLFDNDALGDGQDRWRTGSYGVSLVYGREWTGRLPERAGDLLEFRARAETVAPANLSRPAPADRRYAGLLSFGLHTHAALGRAEARIGADLVVTGPFTGLSGFQETAHDVLGLPRPDASNQLGNHVYPMVSAEIGRPFRPSGTAGVRPFIEGQVGFETLIRAGADLTIGHFGKAALLLRDPVTGQRVAGLRAPGKAAPGGSLTLGGAAVLRRERGRLRAGLHLRGERSELFYGVTWLSPEFEGQSGRQLVGSLQLRLRFQGRPRLSP